MGDIEQAIRELLDRDAIRELPVRYCDCAWRSDIDGIVDLFTDDGLFVIKLPNGRETAAKGSEELHRSFSSGLEIKPRPYIHNHVVELIDAEHAIGRCYLDLRSGKFDMNWIGAGYYNDEYRKVGGRWKIASRICIFSALQMPEDPTQRSSSARTR